MKNLLFCMTNGSWQFEGFGNINDAPIIKNCDYYYPAKKDENGELILDENGEWIDDDADDVELLDECGSGIGLTVAELKSGLGLIDIDGRYKSYKAITVDDIDDCECEAIVKYYEKHYRNLDDEEVDLLLAVSECNDFFNDDVAEIFEHRSFWQFDLLRDTRDTAPDYVVKAHDWMIENNYHAIIEEDEE